MKRSNLVSFLHVLLLLPVASPAQDSALNRRDNAAPVSPGLPSAPVTRLASSPDPAPAGGREVHTDLYGEQEILARPDLWRPWTISMTSGGDWHSNAALANSGAESDYVLRQSAALRYTGKLSDSWYVDLGTAGQTVRYNKFDILDFDRIDADGGVLWISPPEWHPVFRNWILSSRVSWYRLSEAGHFNNELFTNTALSNSLIRSFALHRHHSLLFSLGGEFSLEASSDDIQRDEFSALLAWQASWSPRWESTLLARAAIFDYDRRDDTNLIGSLSLDYIIHKNLRLGLNGSWIQNLSSESAFEYGNASTGVSLRLQLRF